MANNCLASSLICGNMLDIDYVYNPYQDTPDMDLLLDSDTTIKNVDIENFQIDYPVIRGYALAQVGDVIKFKIINFKPNVPYVLSSKDGDVTIDGNIISFKVNNNTGRRARFKINGHEYQTYVISKGPYNPSLSAIGTRVGLTLTNVCATLSNFCSRTQASWINSDFQVSTDSDFDNIVGEKLHSSTNCVHLLVSSLDELFVRARFRDEDNVTSVWSDIVRIDPTLANLSIHQPVLTYHASIITGNLKLIMKTSDYFDEFDVAQKDTTYQASLDPNFSTLLVDDLTSEELELKSKEFLLEGLSQTDRVYIRARHRNMYDLFSEWSEIKSFLVSEVEIVSLYPSTLEDNIMASDRKDNDQFGYSTAISFNGKVLIVGTRYRDSSEVLDAGAAYIFRRVEGIWTQEHILEPLVGHINDQYGISVAISEDGNTALVGSNLKDPSGVNNSGAIYVYNYYNGTWNYEATLSANDKGISDNFGWSVSISENKEVIAIGAYRKDPLDVSNAGAVYIYRKEGNSWIQQTILTASDKATNAQFGISVSLSHNGNTIAIGSNLRKYNNDKYAGCAYIFSYRNNEWIEDAIIRSSDLEAYDRFGFSVCLSGLGNTLAVGAYGKNSHQGAVYIFNKEGYDWIEEVKLEASDKTDSSEFGFSVSITRDGKSVAIGSRYKYSFGITNSGCAYIFNKEGNNWLQKTILNSSEKFASDELGHSVSLSGDGSTAAVSCPGRDTRKGIVCIFS